MSKRMEHQELYEGIFHIQDYLGKIDNSQFLGEIAFQLKRIADALNKVNK